MAKRVIITGGAGFIGSHTAEEFLTNGYEVVVIDNLRTGSKENLKSIANKIEFIEGDIRDGALLAKTFKKDDVVVHLAAFVSVPESIKNPGESHDINVNGANAVYMAANIVGAKRVITASSAAIYGNPEKVPIDENHPLKPLSPYALHKCIDEGYGELYSEMYESAGGADGAAVGPSYIFTRFFNVYGPRQLATGGYAAVIPVFAAKIRAGEAARIYGDGSAIRDFIYVKDVARALRLAAEYSFGDKKGGRGCKFAVFNLAAGKPVTVSELWNTLCKILNKDIKPVFGPSRDGDIHTSLADVSKAKAVLGFEATMPFEEGLKTLFK